MSDPAELLLCALVIDGLGDALRRLDMPPDQAALLLRTAAEALDDAGRGMPDWPDDPWPADMVDKIALVARMLRDQADKAMAG